MCNIINVSGNKINEYDKLIEIPPLKVEDKKIENTLFGVIASLHLHSFKPGKLMKPVQKMELIAGKGILNNPRYYNTLNKTTRYPNRNHLSMMEREQIKEHNKDIIDEDTNFNFNFNFNFKNISPGTIRSNIETTGINLIDLIGSNIKIGDSAVVYIYKARVTCFRMDEIHEGLQRLTKYNKLGTICEIIKSGEIKVGDKIEVIKE